ncbi:GSCOCG00001573001-RA-CDS [Cotesia congregata]|uniref:Large ribosomal subunit protein bL27m n=1 Tax=Cotesia congregata TaxID=51543 RepID=A0A8J2MT76_COTCN|nr:GSCOCG00001573001-RA-CDS [Cotesia congregata]CAG5106784.1 Similar to Mrpl27: 39S ribosomal protein L27 [Cotesia congregata]
MSMISQTVFSTLRNIKQNLLTPAIVTHNHVVVRNKTRNTRSTTQNRGGNKTRPYHRGWKCQDGEVVTGGTLLATQLIPRWHPGLNVGFGKNGTLFAIVPGKVVVTCEKCDLNWNHTWVQRHYSDRKGEVIYKKHFNIIPEKQHDRFKLVDAI